MGRTASSIVGFYNIDRLLYKNIDLALSPNLNGLYKFCCSKFTTNLRNIYSGSNTKIYFQTINKTYTKKKLKTSL